MRVVDVFYGAGANQADGGFGYTRDELRLMNMNVGDDDEDPKFTVRLMNMNGGDDEEPKIFTVEELQAQAEEEEELQLS